MSTPHTRGVVFIHSAPAALCPHITWALESVLGSRVQVDWIKQPAAPGLMRMELTRHGPAGTGARITSAFRGWDNLRYEVTEEPSVGCDGSRWSHTPSLGIHHATTSAHFTSSNPTKTTSFATKIGRFTNIGCVAKSSSCSPSPMSVN